jgi:hypothetical protein
MSRILRRCTISRPGGPVRRFVVLVRYDSDMHRDAAVGRDPNTVIFFSESFREQQRNNLSNYEIFRACDSAPAQFKGFLFSI